MPSAISQRPHHEWRALIRLAWPIVAVNLGTQLMAVVDTALSGRIDSLAQAGTGLGATVFFFGSLLGTGIVMGLDPLSSQSIGAGRHGEARRQLWQGVWVALLVSVPLLLLTFVAARGLESIGIAPDLATEARRYLDARLWSLPPLLVMTAMRGYLQAVHRVMPLLITTIIANLFNFGADWTLIFGDQGLTRIGLPALGLPALGVTGLGLATTVATTLHMILLGLAVGQEPRPAELSGVAYRTWDGKVVARICVLGLPIGIHMVAEIGIFTLAGLLAGRIGAVEMAAHHVALQLAALTFMVPLGVGQAASVRVGNAIGALDAERLRAAAKASLTIGTGFMTVSALSMWTIPHLFARVMTADQAVIDLAARLIVIAGAFQLFDGIQVVSAGVLRGAGLTRWTMTANLIAYWIIASPMVVVFGGNESLGVRGIWIGLTLGLFVAAMILVGKLIAVTRRNEIASLSVLAPPRRQ